MVKLFASFLVVAVGLFGALDQAAIRGNPGDCVLMVRPTQQAVVQRIYKQAEAFYQERLVLASKRGVSVQQIQTPRPILSGISTLDSFANATGAEILPFHSEEALARFEPEFVEFLKNTTEHVLIKFNSSPKIRKVIGGRETWSCEDHIFRQANRWLGGPETGIDRFEEMPVPELLGGPAIETLPLPASRPAPNDIDFPKQWDRSCTGQTNTVNTPKGPQDFTCKAGASDINYLVGEIRKPRHKVIFFPIDTGLYDKHPDFNPKRIFDRFAYNSVDGSTRIADKHGHGTHITGTVLQTSGNRLFGAGSINQDIMVVVINMFDPDNGFTTLPAAVRAISWPGNVLLRLKKEGQEYLGVINASWTFFGGKDLGDFSEFKSALLKQLSLGIPFISAAANSNSNNDVGYNFLPQAWAKDFYRKTRAPLITVGATDFNGVRPSFSNYGSRNTAVGAPGHPIYSTLPPVEGPDAASFGNFKLAGFFSGTSMSSPIVALAVTELLAIEDEATWPRFYDRLSASSTKNSPLYGFFGGGLLNLDNFLVADDWPPEAPSGFKIEKVAFDSIDFSFDRPSDINNAGQLRLIGLYNIWVSDQKLDERNFWQGTRLILWPNPTSNREIATIVGLRAGTPIYIVIEAIDQGGNSNVAPVIFAVTSPLHTLWLEHSLTGGFTKENGWEFIKTGDYAKCKDCPALWHKYRPTSEETRVSADLVYQIEGQNNMDTANKYGYKANEGRAISPWIGPLPKDAIFSMVSSRHTGLWYVRQKEDGAKYWQFDGDDLTLTVYRKGKPAVKIADLPATRIGESPTTGAWVNERFSLVPFAGEEIRLAFDFKFSERSYSLGYHNFSGIKIAKLEVFGTRTDIENLPRVPNGSFEKVVPDPNSPNVPTRSRQYRDIPQDQLRFADNWTKDEHVCSGCKWPNDWSVSRIRGDAAQGLAFMRLVNKIRDEKSWVITTSDKFEVKPGLYDLKQSFKIDGNGTVIIIGYDKNDKEKSWLNSQDLPADLPTSGTEWKNFSMAFEVPNDGTTTVKVRYGLKGRKNADSTLDLDDVKIDFLSRRN